MDYDFSPAEQEFREEVRTWLGENVPRDPRPEAGPEMRAFDLAWQRRQYEGGWAGIAWPAEYGGRGLALIEQLIWYEEYALADAPPAGSNFVGLNHGGPTLIARGSEEQKATFLPQILRGEAIWCQGFSEPGAGSDLANLSLRGRIEGDEIVVNGQKVWTSYADVADVQEVLIRTDPDVGRHGGITWAICDMSSPGIEVRPITTMARTPHFAEVFYDDVCIPLDRVVGDVGDGWSVAMSTLGFERGTAFMAEQVELSRRTELLVEEARVRRRGAGRAIDDGHIAARLATIRAEIAALRAMTCAAVSRNSRMDTPGPEGSMIKLFYADVSQRVYRLAVDILGADAMRFVGTNAADGWTGRFMRSFSTSIGGGTSEIQKNIIAERVLGLPRK